ncbi:Calx-beta domain-containing protein [Lysobacter niabensis]|uniref:Calx-beta domain-containing protein n=1 Tax=Agrilutibacter niabensis TaxID=380628 RepID=UPI003619D002
MFPLAFRRTLLRPVAAALLLAAVTASAQPTSFAPSVIGKPVVLEGQLEVLVEDYADGRTRLRHFLKTPQDRIPLEFAGKPPQLQNGTRVRVRGQAQADALALDGSAGSIEALTTVLPNTLGEQSIAVLLVNFSDDTSQPKTIAEAQTLVFGDTSNHYLESSFGQTWFKGQTFGWYTIAMSKATCDANQLASLADAQATQAGVNLAAYQRRVYMFPANSCQWAGLGTLGGTNSQAWVNGTMTMQVVGHELGHNYGLDHAHSLDCDTGVYGQNCTRYSYGDAADLMGNNRTGQFNPFQKERLGWLNDGISPPITTVATSGRYSIEPYSASTVGPKALKIPRGTDNNGKKLWFYLEYRQPIGGDSVLANTGNLTQGVMVRTATEGDSLSSYQLDMSPGSSTQPFSEMADGALAVGQSHYDGDSGVTLTLASTSSTGADIDVQFGAPTCIRAAPEVWVGGNKEASAGATLEFLVLVTNRDSIACPATSFTLTGIVPTGWTGTLGATALTVKAGMTGETTLRVTSPATAALAWHKLWVAASSPESALHTTQNVMPAYYIVVPPCTRAAPTISLTGGGTAVQAGTPIHYTLIATNRDSDTCGATTFALASSVPAGWAGTLSKANVALDPGQTASADLEVASNAAAPVGSYGIGAAMSSPLGALHTASASTTYDVGSTCTRAAPTVSLAGGGTGVAAGTAVSYTLTVTNRDSSACPSTAFTLARSAPTGWASTLSKTAMALAPGATDSAVLNVTSAATAAGGDYGIGVATGSSIGALHTANASASYTVMPPCVRAAPTLSLSGGGTAVTAGTNVGYALSVTNRDSATCAPTTFSLARSVPAGWTGTLGTTGLTLSPGATGSTSLSVTSTATAAAGSFGIGAATSSAVGALHTANASKTYTVAPPPCIRAAPTVALTGGGGAVRAGTNVGYKLTVTNRDSSSCAATTFSLARSVPAGWGATLGTPGLTLGPGATGSTSLSVTSGATATAGSYGIGAATGSTANALHTANASANYLVATSLAIADASIVEGNAGTATAKFTIALAKPTTVPVKFNVATANGTALAGSDFTATTLTGVTIPAGSTSVTVSVPVTGDTSIEGNETFRVNVSNVVGATVSDGVATGTIRNDDTKLSIGDVSIVEGHSGTKSATFTVKLTNVSASPVTFNIATANGTATAGSDYAARGLVALSIPAGSTSKTLTVSITGDAAVEASETFLVNVSGVKGAIVTDAQAVGTIRNDDTVLSIADAIVTEGHSGTKTLSFLVKLSAVSAAPVTFNLATANATAVAGSDYVALALAGQSIPAGTTSKVFNVTVNGDTVREANETFVVNIGGVAGAAVGDAQAVGTIFNDD